MLHVVSKTEALYYLRYGDTHPYILNHKAPFGTEWQNFKLKGTIF